MKKLILPVILLLLGATAGGGAGFWWKSQGETPSAETTAHEPSPQDAHDPHGSEAEFDYARMNNQFVVPVMQDGIMRAMVVLNLTLEVPKGGSEAVYSIEPRLREAFFQALLDMANLGGFESNFTNGENMRRLHETLTSTAVRVAPGLVHDVLVVDILRQDV